MSRGAACCALLSSNYPVPPLLGARGSRFEVKIMPLVETSKNRLWPNVWKTVGFLLLALVLLCVVTGKRWQAQGDELHLLSPSDWSFGTGDMDCIHGGGSFYTYGFVMRIPQSTLTSCTK